MSEESAITVRYGIVMKDAIDPSDLRKAVDIAASRYHYLCKRLVVRDESYVLEPNDLPIVIKHTTAPIALCGPEANYHQWALSYDKNMIVMNNTHAIFDGRGRGPLLHTIMYYYCLFRYEEEVEMENVLLAQTPVSPSEYADPYLNEIPKAKFAIDSKPVSKDVMRLSELNYVNVVEPQLHIVSIAEKDLMSKCKSSDATPNTAITLLICRAIRKIHPNCDKKIIAGVYCDLRSALKVPDTHHSLVTTLDLEYDNRMDSMDFTAQNTIFRGKMLAMSDPGYLLPCIEQNKNFCQYLNSLPTLEQKIKTGTEAMNSLFKAHTFLVSYSGKSNFGSCDKHIAAVIPAPYSHDLGILVEITAADGYFEITWAQDWSMDLYFNGFLKELSSLGLEYDLLYSGQNYPSKVVFG